MMVRRIKTFSADLTALDIEHDCTLPDFIELIKKLVQKIPESEWPNIRVDWDRDYDGPDTISFTHYRDETEAEAAERQSHEARRMEAVRRANEAQERATLAKLKAKYEDDKP